MSVQKTVITVMVMLHAWIYLGVSCVHVIQALLEMVSLVKVHKELCLNFDVFKKEYFFLDIIECDMQGKCDPHAFCNNTIGSFMCTCQVGYSGDGFQCVGTFTT